METRTPDGRLAAWIFELPVVDLRAGYRAAVYFDRSRRILAAERDDTRVTMQVFQRSSGMVACGIDEALAVLALGAGSFADPAAADEAFAGYLAARNWTRQARSLGGAAYVEAVRAQVEAEAAFDRHWRPAGAELQVTALRDGDRVDEWEPVVEITAPYRLVAHLESVYLGVLARRTLVATNVRGVVDAAGGKPVLFFGDRYDHWATQGGLGTIPHALIATFQGDTVAAVAAFARHVPGVPLIALVDFDNDSVATSLACAREFGERLWGVRLDTSSTMVDRSLWKELGDFNPTGVNPRLVQKVRQALDAEGFQHVRVIVSGGFTADRIQAFEAAGVPVDSYAVGSSLLKGTADYTADVVLREGRPCAKVGRYYRPSDRLQPVELGTLSSHNSQEAPV